MKYIYLHGFASGPRSGKARFFAGKLESIGIDLRIPDLAENDFEHLTISKQLAVIDREIGGEPAVLFGSSMGGYLAALSAARHPEITRLILLAPAFGFAHRWPDKLGAEDVGRWRETGSREFFHYAFERPMAVGWELMADGLTHPAEPDFGQPTLIFHGTADDVVPPSFSVDFARNRPNVHLTLLPSDHQLNDQVETIWAQTLPFIGERG